RTVFRIVLPVAMPGILAGVILAIGRIVGETAALMYTLGTSTNTPSSLMSSGRSLALHMYMLSSEGLHVNEAYATGVILIITVLMINTLSSLLIEGQVLLDEQDIYSSKFNLNQLRKRVGMVFQQPNPFAMSIYDNVAYGPRTHGIRDKKQLDALVEKSLKGAAIWEEV
ncbi:ABC transporter permease subunit, partial [Streptococcus pneumoniae]|uniref:ABC transporter permease subunit n=1 Tax=Streptococcus pneumoniae TaxID=1313 RepID=UPI000B1BA393